MGYIVKQYKKNVLCRYDKDPAIPYYSVDSFKDLKKEEFSFDNSRDIKVKYFFYYRDNYLKDKIVLFCPGIGPGHTAYLKEIDELTLAGFKVLTLDYSGCGESSGDSLLSLNEPTRDINDLLNHLNLKEEVSLFGHSLGAYSALNTINKRKEITKAVIMSGFISAKNEILFLLKSKLVTSVIMRYERKAEPDYFGIDNVEYLKTTNDKLLFIHSTDDHMVGFDSSFKIVKGIENSNIDLIELNDKMHNPDYTKEAVNYLMSTFTEYESLIKNKTLKTIEDRIDFFKDKSIEKMTKIDHFVFDRIIDHLK